MKLIYLLLWFSFKNINKAHGKRNQGYEKEQFSGHVVGGVEVPITMYPHVALLNIDQTQLCGGSIVSDRVVVTAAHCLMDIETKDPVEPKTIKVYLGSAYLLQGKMYKVCKVVPHEIYMTLCDLGITTYLYDIAVLTLSKRIKFGPTIKKIAIAPDDSWKKQKYSFTIAGFGTIETYGRPPEKLLATRMHYVDGKTCNQSQSAGHMLVPDHMFCMIGQRWTSDCFGDSGSGVIWKKYIVGVVATGRDVYCGADMVPSMYTDVTYFRDWVHSKIQEADSLQACQSNTKQTKF